MTVLWIDFLLNFQEDRNSGFARWALAAKPELIICDEVTSALDQIVQEGILRLLMDLQSKLGITYIFITHDIATVCAISDEIVVMYQGKVVEQGLKTEVLSPLPDYTQSSFHQFRKWTLTG